jgi:hypothetical protein
VGYLLRCRTDDDGRVAKLEISLKLEVDKLSMSLTVTRSSASDAPGEGRQIEQPNDPLLIAVETARDDAGLGMDVVQSIIKKHGGTLTGGPSRSDGETRSSVCLGFQIDLPRPTDPRQ